MKTILMSKKEVEKLEAQNAELLEALKEARTTIHAWHNMYESRIKEGTLKDEAWELYQNAPEMKQINQAIKKVES